MISGSIPQAFINITISSIIYFYEYLNKNKKYLLDKKFIYKIEYDIKYENEYNMYFIDIYKFYYKYIQFIILNKTEYENILTIKNLINNNNLITSYNYLKNLYNYINNYNIDDIKDDIIKYIINNINIKFDIFNIYKIDILLNSHIKDLGNCNNKDIIKDGKINHTFIINILYGLYDYTTYDNIIIDDNFIVKTFVYIMNNTNSFFYLYYLSLLNDFTCKITNYKLIDFKKSISRTSTNYTEEDDNIFIDDKIIDIKNLNNIINNNIKNIINDLY